MRKVFFLFLIATGTLGSQAQNITKSPYSRFGVGELNFQGYAEQSAMGQVSIADRSNLRYSLANPASYSALRMTNFRFGGMGYNGTLEDSKQKLSIGNVSFAYLNVGFQINKKKDWGLVFGITPYSSVGYNIEYKVDSSFGSYTNRFLGGGGLSRYFLGTGKRFGDHLSVGVQGSFLMGTTDISKEIVTPSNSTYLGYKENSTNYLKGFYVEGGVQYEHDHNIRHLKTRRDSLTQIISIDTSYTGIRHVFGLTYQGSGTLNGREEFFSRTASFSGNQAETKDTILFTTINGKMVLPASIGFGYMINERNGLWRAGVDFRQTFWSQYTSDFNSFKFKNSYQVSAGFAWRFTTDFENKNKNFLQKTEYRIGGRYNSGIAAVNGTSISEMGVSLGFGLPLRMRPVTEEFKYETVFSSLDFSFEYMQRGSLANNLVKENYFRFVVGVSLNDKWFNKRKIE